MRALALCVGVALVPCAGVHAAEPVAVRGRAMGTTWSAKWIPSSAAVAPERVGRELAEALERLEGIFSTYRPGSELSRFNREETTDWIPVSPELAAAAARSRAVSELTGGAFDATIEPLLRLWGIGPHPAPDVEPEPASLAAALARTGWRLLEVRSEPPALRKTRPDLAADFSSVAKGLAADEMGRLLARLGCGDHLVAVGGDLRAAGGGPRGEGWPVGIEDPAASPARPARTLLLRDAALSTSGNHRNVRLVGGRRVGHLLDARTGRPVTGPLVAVSVVASSGAAASGLATGLFALGAAEGELVARRDGVAAFFLLQADGAGKSRETPAFSLLPEATAQIR